MTHVTESQSPARHMSLPSLRLVKWGILSLPFFNHS